jgi:sporulation protein YlmC with PRC-barrel domain
MKTLIRCGAALAILGLTTASIFAQTQSSTSTTTTNYIQTSKLIGTKVRASQGDEIGEIKDVVLDQNGCMAYTVVSTTGGGAGGRVSGSSSSVKTVAVPWSVYSTTPDPRIMTVRVQKERIYSAPVFEYSRINEYATSGYINNVYSYYGVTPGVGVSTSVSGGVSGSATTTNAGNTTGIGASTNAAATASPGASAASTLPSATPTASVSESASPSPTPGGTASASPSRKAKSGMTPVSQRHRANQLMNGSGERASEASPSKQKGDESSSEASPSKQKSNESSTEASPSKKGKHHGTESGEPSATPKPESEKE